MYMTIVIIRHPWKKKTPDCFHNFEEHVLMTLIKVSFIILSRIAIMVGIYEIQGKRPHTHIHTHTDTLKRKLCFIIKPDQSFNIQ